MNYVIGSTAKDTTMPNAFEVCERDAEESGREGHACNKLRRDTRTPTDRIAVRSSG